LLIPSMQVPPFMQDEAVQSLSLMSQVGPLKPSGQLQV
jgi:hypothetical protein